MGTNFGNFMIDFVEQSGAVYTSIARWVFIFLALFILLRSIFSLLRTKHSSEVWAYWHMTVPTDDFVSAEREDSKSIRRRSRKARRGGTQGVLDGSGSVPITHWENVIGRAKDCDILMDDAGVSRNHGTLYRDHAGDWTYTDLGSKNGTIVNGHAVKPWRKIAIEPGDEIQIGKTTCTLFPVSLEEHRNNLEMRKMDISLLSPWPSLIALTVFQLMTLVQLFVALGKDFVPSIAFSFVGICAVMWIYTMTFRALKRNGFEMEFIAFFLCTLSLAVTASKYPDAVLKQFIAIVLGMAVFICMCTFMRSLDRAKAVKPFMYAAATGLLLFNLVFATVRYGAANWVEIGGFTFQPSEIVKLAFIWVGAASLNELFEKRNSLVFMIFSGFCFCCLAIMGDFGTAIIFFVTFLIISFLRSGDFTKLILVVGVAFVGGLMVLKFKSYIAERFSVWGHVWEYADSLGYQQTRTMSASASGGLVGVGAGEGWLNQIAAADTDLVFGMLIEEWGLIVAILAVLSIITLSVFACRSILAGRSAFYTIGACSAMSMYLFQTILNVFGSVDLFPLTGVTFPFVSNGGTSMIASWGLLAFLKAADTRPNASIAISLSPKGIHQVNKERKGATK